MGRSTKRFGKVVDNYKGFNIRMMMNDKTNEKTKKVMKQHTGKFGIYAGKNLKREVAKVEDAYKAIDSEIGK